MSSLISVLGPPAMFGHRLTRRLERPCTACHGTGSVTSEGWKTWVQEHDRLLTLGAAARNDDTIHHAVFQLLRAHTAHSPAGRRHVRCEPCAGSGRIPTQKGQHILAFLARHAH